MRSTRRSVLQGVAAAGLAARLGGVVARATVSEAGKPFGGGRRRWTAATAARTRPIGPERIESSDGSVVDAASLLRGGTTTLRARAGEPATVVLDYGRIVGGLPLFEITAVTGQPTLTVVYSQALPWLLPDGDGPAPGKPGATRAAPKEISFVGVAGAADLSRVETIALRAGRIVGRLVQGGQRFQALVLHGVGSVRLTRVGFLPTFRRERPSKNAGRFECSDAALTEIWSLGEYALDVASIPAGALPPLWDIGPGGATVYGDSYAGYLRGLEWRDYAVRFDVRIDSNEASWLVRGQAPDGIRFVLCADEDRLRGSSPNTLRVYVQFTGRWLASFPLPLRVREGCWHGVQTVVRGSQAHVVIDGRPVGTVDIPVEGGFWGSTARGWVALANASGAIATFRALEVVASDRRTLLRTELTDPSILDEFAAGSNGFATVVDGATRDRLLFGGDLGVAARTLLYSGFALPQLSDSLSMLASFRAESGAIPTSVPPQANPPRTPNGAFAALIPDYTVHFVTTLHAYWLHTGDTPFLRRQWDAVRGVFRYLAQHTEPRTGLFVSPPFPGTSTPVTETLVNAHYYGALQAAVAMGRGLDHARDVAEWSARAQALRLAVNRHLFNRQTGLYGLSTADLATIDELSNAYAVLYGIAETGSIARLLRGLAAALHRDAGPLRSSGPQGEIVSPYTAGFEVAARFEVGDARTALELIRRAWGSMRRPGEYYSGGTWEYVGLDGTPGLGSSTSLAHPWSSGPTAALSAYVLGVRPIEPGFSTWLVEPQPGDLRWARGVVPTPMGPIGVDWRQQRRSLALRFDVPRRTSGYVGLPLLGERRDARLDGRSIELHDEVPGVAARAGYGYHGPVASGRHVLRIAT